MKSGEVRSGFFSFFRGLGCGLGLRSRGGGCNRSLHEAEEQPNDFLLLDVKCAILSHFMATGGLKLPILTVSGVKWCQWRGGIVPGLSDGCASACEFKSGGGLFVFARLV